MGGWSREITRSPECQMRMKVDEQGFSGHLKCKKDKDEERAEDLA